MRVLGIATVYMWNSCINWSLFGRSRRVYIIPKWAILHRGYSQPRVSGRFVGISSILAIAKKPSVPHKFLTFSLDFTPRSWYNIVLKSSPLTHRRNKMAKHRSAFQLLQEAQAKINNLKARVARETVSEHKDIQRFDARIQNVQKELTKVRRWTNEEQGLSARIEKLTNQIAEAEHNLSVAESKESELASTLAGLRADRQAKAEELIQGQEIEFDFEAGENE